MQVFGHLRAVSPPGIGIPGPARPILQVIEEAYSIFDHWMRLNHLLLFSFIPSSALQLSWLIHVLVSAFNTHVRSDRTASSPCGIGIELTRGIFVSGGSLTSIIVARNAILAPNDYPRALIYIGDQIRKVPSDDSCRMRVRALRKQTQDGKAKGLFPFLIVGTFGCTGSGAIDPCKELSDITKEENWLYVDGAYGASAALSHSQHQTASELGYADSVAWDEHEWLTRDKAEFWGLGLELTRPARTMSLWFTLRVLGTVRTRKMTDHRINLVEPLQRQLEVLPDWEILTLASLAILNFRYEPVGRSDEKVDLVNLELSRRFIERNIAAIMTVETRRVALRVRCINTRLRVEDMVNLIRTLT
ncbi:pyridoxal phosphate-dependent transferase [Aspergillus alliaceus]|uniref:Pyridoxal phosphate-dependent transferase n=1 Tax=Petromyces alliaceus TaxID=209559 RepID=A0A5N7C918_PETAA|nr:pyridoxal phosphate-dependent transferase [Aspergillus alliaceus]